jgi:hypothetical protein
VLGTLALDADVPGGFKLFAVSQRAVSASVPCSDGFADLSCPRSDSWFASGCGEMAAESVDGAGNLGVEVAETAVELSDGGVLGKFGRGGDLVTVARELGGFSGHDGWGLWSGRLRR